MVRDALAQTDGSGPITLSGARGVLLPLGSVDMQERGVCGRALQERAVHADWVETDVTHKEPGPLRCRPYQGLRRARPGLAF